VGGIKAKNRAYLIPKRVGGIHFNHFCSNLIYESGENNPNIPQSLMLLMPPPQVPTLNVIRYYFWGNKELVIMKTYFKCFSLENI
jgi:hypothetical protein